MFLGVHDLDGPLRIDVRTIEKAQAVFQRQHAPHGPIHQRHRDPALLHVLDQGLHIGRFVSDIEIHAGLQGQGAGFFLGGDDAFRKQGPESAALTEHQPLESHFFAEHAGQLLLGGMRGDA